MCFVFPGTSTSTSFLARARLDARGFPSSPPPPRARCSGGPGDNVAHGVPAAVGVMPAAESALGAGGAARPRGQGARAPSMAATRPRGPRRSARAVSDAGITPLAAGDGGWRISCGRCGGRSFLRPGVSGRSPRGRGEIDRRPAPREQQPRRQQPWRFAAAAAAASAAASSSRSFQYLRLPVGGRGRGGSRSKSPGPPPRGCYHGP